MNSILFQNNSAIQTLIELYECERADFVNVTIQKNFYTSGSYTAYIKSKSSTLSIIDSNISSNLFRFGLLNIMDTELYIFNSKFEYVLSCKLFKNNIYVRCSNNHGILGGIYADFSHVTIDNSSVRINLS